MEKKTFKFGGLILLATSLTLAGCGAEEEVDNKKETQQVAKTNESEEKNNSKETEKVNWKKEIKKISHSDDSESDKFSVLEKFLVAYEASEKETKNFSKDIVEDYKGGEYLEGTDYEKLVKIFKSYVVQKNADGYVKEFAFDYFQNQKYVYRGVDQPGSSAVQSNERQMDKALKNIK